MEVPDCAENRGWLASEASSDTRASLEASCYKTCDEGLVLGLPLVLLVPPGGVVMCSGGTSMALNMCLFGSHSTPQIEQSSCG